MKSLRFLSLYYCLSFFVTPNSAIGPVADLVISNSQISPDGYARSTVLAGGTFPGPPIKGVK
ncbi:laccase, partial [Tricholoma furcatifolium]